MRHDLLVHRWCREAVEKGSFTVYEPHASRAITSIEDATSAIAFLIERPTAPSDIYHVVSLNESKQDIAILISKVTGCGVRYIDNGDTEGRDYEAVPEKMVRLGFEFKPELRANIERICQYYHDNHAHPFSH
jgi:nucleoside-diphosphate-sugar epimerase